MQPRSQKNSKGTAEIYLELMRFTLIKDIWILPTISHRHDDWLTLNTTTYTVKVSGVQLVVL